MYTLGDNLSFVNPAGQNNTIQYSFISAQHICSVHVMSVIVVDIYINAGLGDSY